jgi:hypothetical protein
MLVRLATLRPWAGERIDDVAHPLDIETLWSVAELAAIGLAAPRPFPTPPGKRIKGEPRYILDADRTVSTLYDIEDIPPLTIIFKADIWRRATEAEAEAIDARLNAQPLRLRRLWQDSQFLATTDEHYPAIRDAFVAAFGAERARQLLEPTA